MVWNMQEMGCQDFEMLELGDSMISSIRGVGMLRFRLISLVLVAQEVVDGLDGVEGLKGHFHEDGGPVAHGAIPQSGEFKSFQLTAVLGLEGDEACGRIHEVRKVEAITLIVACGTDEVNGIEVSTALEHGHVGRVVGVNL